MTSPYEILGISEDATQEDIKKAYRDLAKQWHPDRHPDNKGEAEAEFKKISAAYEQINTPEKKQKYDESARWSDAPDWMDFIFSQHRPQRGSNLRVLLEITLEMAVKGGDQRISVTRPATCRSCNGDGATPGNWGKCSHCRGSGRVSIRSSTTGFFSFSQNIACPSCFGRGKVFYSPCPECSGTCITKVQEELIIPIPPGVGDGQLLRIAGKGADGPGGPGDLILVVRVKKHDRLWRVDENDLATSIEVPLIIALRGGTVEVEGLDSEKIWVKIPKACPYGHDVPVADKGINGGRLLVRVTFRLPRLDDAQLDKIAEALH